MGKQIVAAVDQGTTSTRCILFDRDGQVIAMAQKEHAQICPQPGWVEHDPEEIWRNLQWVTRSALARAGLDASRATEGGLAAIGLTNQRETAILWDRRTGEPLHNAVVWQDLRVETEVRALAREGGIDRFRSATGLPLATYFSALKLRWMLDNIPGARGAAERGEALFGTVDSFLAWRLTGGPEGGRHVTDVTNASRTQLMNLRDLQWDPELLAAFDIPPSCLPEIRSSSEIYGIVHGLEGGFLEGVPLAGILGDQQAALVGQACLKPGAVKNTYGTGCFLLMNTGREIVASRSGLISTVGYRFGKQPACYALEGSIAVTGALVQWLRDKLGLIRSSEEIEALAASVPDNGGVYIVPAFAGLFAPYWRSDARGVICGLTGHSGKAHLARAALEAAAFQTAEILAAMKADCGIAVGELRCDGGMAVNDLLMQFQADMLALPVLRPRIVETTALGAAYAAGLAVGIWDGPEELAAHWAMDRRWQPEMAAEQRDRLQAEWRKAVSRSFDWVD